MATRILLESPRTMGRKKAERKTVMVRAYEESAEVIRKAAGERGLSVAEFVERFMIPCAERAHRDYIRAESKKLKGDEE